LDGGGGGAGGGAGAFITPNCAGGFGGGVGEGIGDVTFMADNCARSPIAMPPPTPLAFDLDLALFLE
jgi:hypothetical protein